METGRPFTLEEFQAWVYSEIEAIQTGDDSESWKAWMQLKFDCDEDPYQTYSGNGIEVFGNMYCEENPELKALCRKYDLIELYKK